jgi:protein-arginine kinase activator protein McsA
MLKCNVCKEYKSEAMFTKSSQRKRGYLYLCRTCNHNKHQELLNNKPEWRLYRSTKNSAKARGLVHTIKPEDIPTPSHCKYLDIVLDYHMKSKQKYDSASVDRIDSSKGYTPDNIQVISILANSMKANATTNQLITFSINILHIHAPYLWNLL